MMLSSNSSKYTQFGAEENKKRLKGSNYFFNASENIFNINFTVTHLFVQHLLSTCSVSGTLLATGE